MLHGFAFEPEFPPFIDEPAGLDEPATGWNLNLASVPPDASDGDDRIDAETWRKFRERCRVRRFWGEQPDEIGHLVRKPGGAWAFHYDINGDEDDDETGYRFNNHLFRLGEYVSLREHDDELRTFRVVSVTDLPD